MYFKEFSNQLEKINSTRKQNKKISILTDLLKEKPLFQLPNT